MISGTRYSITTEVARQQRLSADIAQIQTDISSGIKIHTASDDPIAARRIAQIQATQSSQTQWTSNITVAKQVSSQLEDSLGSVTTALVRAKELMLKGNTDTAGAADRDSVATELQGIMAELDTVGASTDFTGTPLYARTGTSPAAIPVGPDLAIAASDSYDRVFGQVTLADGTTTDIKTILTGAITALRGNDDAGMTKAAAGIDAAQAHISVVTTDAGVRTQRITAAEDRLATAKISLADERSSLESTDVTAAAADLIQKKTQLDAAQAILAQLSRSTLFDKLS
ncbi:flagellin [Sphingomonas sp.]|uniref:flagellin N-terminal helical domain-containing protein n=1 Tax=Sphingomonas sp. TaxID=28214 RepID=UPI003B00E262